MAVDLISRRLPGVRLALQDYAEGAALAFANFPRGDDSVPQVRSRF
jgi:hypothetical protein